jgi:hypothetical protein
LPDRLIEFLNLLLAGVVLVASVFMVLDAHELRNAVCLWQRGDLLDDLSLPTGGGTALFHLFDLAVGKPYQNPAYPFREIRNIYV